VSSGQRALCQGRRRSNFFARAELDKLSRSGFKRLLSGGAQDAPHGRIERGRARLVLVFGRRALPPALRKHSIVASVDLATERVETLLEVGIVAPHTRPGVSLRVCDDGKRR
jgi:hypothetical protein